MKNRMLLTLPLTLAITLAISQAVYAGEQTGNPDQRFKSHRVSIDSIIPYWQRFEFLKKMQLPREILDQFQLAELGGDESSGMSNFVSDCDFVNSQCVIGVTPS